MNQPPIREVSPAWAELVRKVAIHDDLVSALEVAEAELEQHTGTPGVAEHVLPCIRGALAKAKEASA
jgi:hypothetical protein